jgi:hypothetical protein
MELAVRTHDVLRVWQEAEAIPLIEHAWAFDHLFPICGDPGCPIFEGWTLLSASPPRPPGCDWACW